MPTVALYDEPYADLMWLLQPDTMLAIRHLVAVDQGAPSAAMVAETPQDAVPADGE